MKVIYSKTFLKQFKKSPDKIQKQFKKRLQIFISGQDLEQLRIHNLKGEYKSYQSMNVSGDWRALFYIKQENPEVIYIFDLIGTHSQLYG